MPNMLMWGLWVFTKNKKGVVEFVYGRIGKLWVLIDFTVTCFNKLLVADLHVACDKFVYDSVIIIYY